MTPEQLQARSDSFYKEHYEVKFADDCKPCPDCGEPFCEECDMHYADCNHPGPNSEEDEDDDA